MMHNPEASSSQPLQSAQSPQLPPLPASKTRSVWVQRARQTAEAETINPPKRPIPPKLRKKYGDTARLKPRPMAANGQAQAQPQALQRAKTGPKVYEEGTPKTKPSPLKSRFARKRNAKQKRVKQYRQKILVKLAVMLACWFGVYYGISAPIWQLDLAKPGALNYTLETQPAPYASHAVQPHLITQAQVQQTLQAVSPPAHVLLVSPQRLEAALKQRFSLITHARIHRSVSFQPPYAQLQVLIQQRPLWAIHEQHRGNKRLQAFISAQGHAYASAAYQQAWQASPQSIRQRMPIVLTSPQKAFHQALSTAQWQKLHQIYQLMQRTPGYQLLRIDARNTNHLIVWVRPPQTELNSNVTQIKLLAGQLDPSLEGRMRRFEWLANATHNQPQLNLPAWKSVDLRWDKQVTIEPVPTSANADAVLR
ncbi:MAG: hypothetical protein VKJ06_06115 [Vampirovibrionales bacterium]|nr:hypothetical protein [Vampirovibrionales bacterium]